MENYQNWGRTTFGEIHIQLTDTEVEDMVSQNAIPSRQVLGGSLPYAFSEFGVLQLSNVLKSERAAQVSTRIIEMFVLLREAMLVYKDTAVLYEKMKNVL